MRGKKREKRGKKGKYEKIEGRGEGKKLERKGK